MKNDIYDTTQIRKKDGELESFLHNLAARENSEIVSRVAERFSQLARKAHDRKHWTGHE